MVQTIFRATSVRRYFDQLPQNRKVPQSKSPFLCANTEFTTSPKKIFFKNDDINLNKSLIQIQNNTEIVEKKHWAIRVVAKNLQTDQSLFIEADFLSGKTFLSK